MKFGNVMDSFENLVCEGVSASPLPPPFDDAAIVAINNETALRGKAGDESSEEELESNGLCPLDVTSIILPARS